MARHSSELLSGPPSEEDRREARTGEWRDISRSAGHNRIAGTGVLWAIVLVLLVVGAILWIAAAA